MGWALENETNPDKLTELVLESLDFGGALETERMAIQSRFEGMLQTQEEEVIHFVFTRMDSVSKMMNSVF